MNGSAGHSDVGSLFVTSAPRQLHSNPAKSAEFRYPMIALHSAVFILAVVGNGLVITTMIRHKRMRTVTNVFLLNLAVSDLLVAVVCMPFTIVPVLMQDFIFGQVTCSIVRYLQGVAVAASAFTLVTISMERYFAICRPLSARKWQVLSHSYKMIAVVWFLSLALNAPLAAFQEVEGGGESRQCVDDWPNPEAQRWWYCFQLLGVDLFAPLVIMSVAYSLIAYKLWKNIDAINVAGVGPESNPTDTKRPSDALSEEMKTSDEEGADGRPKRGRCSVLRRRRRPAVLCCRPPTKAAIAGTMRSHTSASVANSKKKVVKMLVVVVLTFFVCWTPLYVLMVWTFFDMVHALEHIPSPLVTVAVLRLLSYSSSCCNPITYCFMSSTFRAAFVRAFRCRRRRLTKVEFKSQITQVSEVEAAAKE